MLLETLTALFERDLGRLKTEISSYQSEEALWSVDKEIANSGGNLAMHLVGNLKAFVGAELGGTGYVRDREFEFAGKGLSKSQLVSEIEETIEIVSTTLKKLGAEELKKDFPVVVFGKKTNTEYMLVHLATHLSYHLGQVNYHRRLLDA
ncbi:MAG: DUF1572 family protein [Cyclobacteriaceae bacterium]